MGGLREGAARAAQRPAYDAALAAWQDVLAGREPLVVTASRENDVRRALALADEFKVRVVVAGAPQASRVAELVKARKLPLLVSVNFDPPRAAAASARRRTRSASASEIDEAERNPAALHKAGVPFALVSGHAPDFLAGVRKAIERGLPARRGAARGHPGRGGGAGRRRPAGQPGGRQDRQRRGLVGRAAGQGREGEDGVRGRPRSTSRTRRPTAEGQAGRRRRRPQPVARCGGAAMRAPWPAAASPPRRRSRSPSSAAPSSPSAPQGTIENGHGAHPRRQDRGGGHGRRRCPPGARVIDATGRYVMPGIIDAHSHTAIEGGVNECTDVGHGRGAHRRRARPPTTSTSTASSPAASPPSTSCTAPATRSAARTRCIKLRWGKPPEELALRGRAARHQVRAGREPEALELPRARAPPRYPATRMGVEVVLREAFQRGAGLQARVGGVRAQAQGGGRQGRAAGRRRAATCELEALRDVLEGKV